MTRYYDIYDLLKAQEALDKANVPCTYKVVCSDAALGIEPDYYEDTYTLIPNGKWVMIPSDGVINHYLVQHDQSGETISWRGPSRMNYYDHDLHVDFNNFETFYESWSDNDRKKWKTQELVRIKQQHPYYDPDVNELVKAYDEIFNKENNMQYAYNNAAVATVVAAETDESKQRKYLISRLRDIREEKGSDAYVFFKLDPVASPRTFNEFMEKVKSGDITYEGKDKDMKHWSLCSLLDTIRWSKDPADHEGYNAAIKKMDDEMTKVMDTISILSPEEGLKALQAFEAKKFH